MNNIRKAVKEDISRIAEILVFTKRIHYRHIFNDDKASFGEIQVVPVACEFIDNENQLNNYFVYDDEFVKGLISIEGNEIKELYVDDFFQGKGIGSQLIEFAINNYKAEYLWVLEKNSQAISFYKKHGFEVSGEKRFAEGTNEFEIEMNRQSV